LGRTLFIYIKDWGMDLEGRRPEKYGKVLCGLGKWFGWILCYVER
jgi:hypothetical protein